MITSPSYHNGALRDRLLLRGGHAEHVHDVTSLLLTPATCSSLCIFVGFVALWTFLQIYRC